MQGTWCKIRQWQLVGGACAKITHEGKVTILVLWNQQVQTDRTIFDSKPYILIHDNENGTFMLIDVAILVDRNVI